MRQRAAGRVAWRSGDGASRLYHGDSVEVLRTLPDESVDCVWTDPPYLLSNDGVTCVSGRMVTVNKGEWDRSRGTALDHDIRWGPAVFCVGDGGRLLHRSRERREEMAGEHP